MNKAVIGVKSYISGVAISLEGSEIEGAV